MQIKTSEKILFSDLAAQPGTIFVVPTVEVFQGKPAHDVLAGICLHDADGPGHPRYLTIEFHRGRHAWHLKTEYSIQRATQWEADILPNLIQRFESLVRFAGESAWNIKLPTIKVVDFGVGIYAAQGGLECDNPWRIEDGKFYTVRDPKRGERTFAADVRNGRTLIGFVTEDAAMEMFDPLVVLSAHEWRSLSPAPEEIEPQAGMPHRTHAPGI